MKPLRAGLAALWLCVAATQGLFAAPPPRAVNSAVSPGMAPQATAPAPPPAVPTLRIVADVMINGRGPFHFMLDTGATQAVIADSTVARLQLRPDPHQQVSVQGVNARVMASVVHIDSLRFGALQFEGVDLPVLAGPMFDGLDGILGAQGLDRMQVSVSVLDHHCIIAASPRHADTPAKAIIRLASQQLPMVTASIGGVRVRVIIDTGASNTLANTALLAALQKTASLRALQPSPAVLDVTAVAEPGVTAQTPPLVLGGVALQPPAITFGDYQVFERWGLARRPAMLLGMDSLATLQRFSIDYARLQLQLSPRPAAVLSSRRAWPQAMAL